MNTQGKNEPITLSALAGQISAAIGRGVSGGQWVVAEISELKVHPSTGHCYLSLVERSQAGGGAIAEVRAMIWSRDFGAISGRFMEATGGGLQSGMKLLFCGDVTFHPQYGLSVRIVDVDPSYTIGEGEIVRRQTIERLEREKVMTLQREQNELPIVVQRLAVVSSSQAAGYQDFYNQLLGSEYRFEVDLYEASMQGERTTKTVLGALNSILESGKEYDAVVIIRGGGAVNDLRWFDDYELCFFITQFPLPILTGIGHDKDVSVTDMVAYHSFKTPTAVAAGLIERIAVIDNRLTGYWQQVVGAAQHMIMEEGQRGVIVAQNLRAATMQVLGQNNVVLERLTSQVPMLAKAVMDKEENRMAQLGAKVQQEGWFGLQSAEKRLAGAAQMLRTVTMSVVEREIKRVERATAVIEPVCQNAFDRQLQKIQQITVTVVQNASRITDTATARLEYLTSSFHRTASALVDREKSHLSVLSEKVAGNNPRRILGLGYSIAMDTTTGKVIKNGQKLTKGQSIRVEFADSVATTVVERVEKK